MKKLNCGKNDSENLLILLKFQKYNKEKKFKKKTIF